MGMSDAALAMAARLFSAYSENSRNMMRSCGGSMRTKGSRSAMTWWISSVEERKLRPMGYLEQGRLERRRVDRDGRLENFVGGGCDERVEQPVLVAIQRLDEDQQAAAERQALELPDALREHAAADVEIHVGIVEVVQEVEHQDRVALGADVGEQVEHLVAGERARQADALEHLADSRCTLAQRPDEGVGGQPFAARDGVEGAA